MSNDGFPGARPGWLTATGRYLPAAAARNVLWERAQVPLYTLWHTGSAWEITRAVLHCVMGDLALAIGLKHELAGRQTVFLGRIVEQRLEQRRGFRVRDTPAH